MNRKPFNFNEWQENPYQPLWLANGDRVVEIKYYPKEFDDKFDILCCTAKSKDGSSLYNVYLNKDGKSESEPNYFLMMKQKTTTKLIPFTKRIPFDLDIYLTNPEIKVFTRLGFEAHIRFFKEIAPSCRPISGFVKLGDMFDPCLWGARGTYIVDYEIEHDLDLFLEIQ